MKRNKGFTLIELSIVLIIISILFGFGIRSCISAMIAAKVDKTKDQLNNLSLLIERKLCEYGIWNKDIEEEIKRKKDGWNREIKFFIYEGIKQYPVCSVPYTKISVKSGSQEFNDVLVLLISPGENGKFDTSIPNKNFIKESTKIAISGDDIAKIITLSQVKNKCCRDKRLRIITSYLPPIIGGEDYEVKFIILGGEKPYNFLFKTNNSTLNAILARKYTKSKNDFFLLCRNTFSRLCTFKLTSDETEKIAKNSNLYTINALLRVEDRLGNIAHKEFIINLISRY